MATPAPTGPWHRRRVRALKGGANDAGRQYDWSSFGTEWIHMLALLAEDLDYDQTGGGGISSGALIAILLVYLVLVVVILAAAWRVFTKAGQPGWAAIVPLYNGYVLLKVVGRPGWWLVLFFIPVVGIVVGIIVALDLAKSFGKGGGFAVLLILLPVIGYPMLGFGPSQYVGPAALRPQ